MTSIDDREYWIEKEERMAREGELARRQAAEPRTILHRLHVQYTATPDGDTAKRAEIMRQINGLSTQIKADEMARFLSEWTLDVTKARRIEWNTLAAQGKFLQEIHRLVSFRFEALRKAIQHYGL